ncbi:MAG: Sua5/YciO/YrdC/YwlC family protein, partial [Flavobacteriaceae bacterium]|nr:Sua5/YciO/YrdC/YwlC family protein [Flavobacteriaceae bacterium]
MISTNIQAACQILNNNDLVAIPTETVYGLAANALNEK